MINDAHPYTNRPMRDYLTVVVEKTNSEAGNAGADLLFDSLSSGKECSAIPGYRVTALSIGDEMSQKEWEEEKFE